MHAGFIPSTGALITPIELTSDRKVQSSLLHFLFLPFSPIFPFTSSPFYPQYWCFQAYFVGKPSAIIMNHALKKFDDLQRSDVVIIGDNMDTDIRRF
jgi:hypothetical protein